LSSDIELGNAECFRTSSQRHKTDTVLDSVTFAASFFPFLDRKEIFRSRISKAQEKLNIYAYI